MIAAVTCELQVFGCYWVGNFDGQVYTGARWRTATGDPKKILKTESKAWSDLEQESLTGAEARELLELAESVPSQKKTQVTDCWRLKNSRTFKVGSSLIAPVEFLFFKFFIHQTFLFVPDISNYFQLSCFSQWSIHKLPSKLFFFQCPSDVFYYSVIKYSFRDVEFLRSLDEGKRNHSLGELSTKTVVNILRYFHKCKQLTKI